MGASVVAVSRDDRHSFSKPVADSITLIAGYGIEGDAHAGTTVQHLHLVRTDPHRPNLRQVHLMEAEFLAELAGLGHEVQPGQLGENVTTHGIDLLGLPQGALLRLGPEAVVEATGLRAPCSQINGLGAGLLKLMVRKNLDGSVTRRAGLMSIVRTGGVVHPDDPIEIEYPAGDHVPLDFV
ncbi:MOSC domain-containing protein YiiM [Kribbella amoyensis]|uniref:MOSC domain-containing protein YiiM n=1 Tax=Kribbella amoyensis TaxID=996641 RepID=A0A561BZG6_9ACTN|nr:MOSC domain-containing protein [Kribbella amoyensis]TWD84273.1 MOSC domain-containing protein YiiM [Kribbella amoyensis]